MRKILSVAIVLISLILLGCGGDNSCVSKVHYLKGLLLENRDLELLSPDMMKCCGEDILFYSSKSECVFAIYDLYNDKVVQFGKIGKGPGEFLSVSSLEYNHKNSSIYFLDLISREINTICLDSIYNSNFELNTVKINGTGIYINLSLVYDSLYIVGGAYQNNRFALINRNGSVVNMIGDYDSVDMPKGKYKNFQIGVTLQDMIMVYPDSNLFVSNVGHCFEIFRIENNNINRICTTRSSEQIPVFVMGKNKLAKAKQNIIGFQNGALYKDRIFYLFDKRSREEAFQNAPGYSNCIKVYKWNGEFEFEILLDHKIKRFDIDRSGNLYALGINNDFEPVLLKYVMPELK